MTRSAVVVIGCSAGGVAALQALIRRVPAGFEAPVFIVMHIPAHTPSHLASILQRHSVLPVKEAIDGEAIVPGTVYVATADRHLMVEGQNIRVTRGPKEGRSRPAIDVLFRSAAASFGPGVVGVVLTGTLDDGTAGLWAIKDQGGVALVQEPATAEFSSMPESAIEHVDVDKVLPLEDLAHEIVRRVNQRPARESHVEIPRRMEAENLIARQGNALKAGVMKLGKVSAYTCPECHGVLVQIEEGRITRFRCHTGHSYSLKTLLAEVDESIEASLWATMRAIEERVLLLRHMAEIARRSNNAPAAAEMDAQANESQQRASPLRDLVFDSKLFSSR